MPAGSTRSKSPPKAKKRTSRPTPSTKLQKLAKRNRPPQSWFDQTDVPFTPRKD